MTPVHPLTRQTVDPKILEDRQVKLGLENAADILVYAVALEHYGDDLSPVQLRELERQILDTLQESVLGFEVGAL